jgi:AcrR family transcriptional regulator
MPKGFTAQEKELIRKRLLKEGYKQLAAHGLKKTSVEELAEAAKISKGAFYLFYESKEALFMDVVEMAEQHFRQDILAAVELPGPSPRARLFSVFKQALALAKTMPLLQFLTSSDFDVLFRRMPAEKLREHLASDREFSAELVARCRGAGIPIRAQPEEIMGLLYPLVLMTLREDEPGRNAFTGSLDLLLELVAAFCLGEVERQVQQSAGGAPDV